MECSCLRELSPGNQVTTTQAALITARMTYTENLFQLAVQTHKFHVFTSHI